MHPFHSRLPGAHPLAELRGVLIQPPSQESWEQVQELLEAWSETGEDLELVMSYLESHITQWTDEMLVCSKPYRFEELGRLYKVFHPKERIRRRQLARLLNQMPNLKEINLSQRSLGKTGIEMLLQVPTLENLHTLNLSHTELNDEAVTLLSKARNLKNLKVLHLSGNNFTNPGAKALASTRAFPQLQELHLENCTQFHFFHMKSGLSSLEVLNMEGCRNLSRFSLQKVYPKLRSFTLSRNQWLLSLDALQDMPALEEASLKFNGFQSLELTSAQQHLKHLDLTGCYRLGELWGLDSLDSIQSLCLFSCYSIQRVPDLYLLDMIPELNIESSSVIRDEQGDLGIDAGRGLGLDYW